MTEPKQYLWVFALWLAAFYGCWGALVVLSGLYELVIAHWPMAVAMSAGSYFAGSTPMGGGTVGFPVLVLLFGQPATLGRDFSFAVQSIGMTSASIYILASRQPLAWTMLKWAVFGSLIGTPLGLTLVAPFVPGPMAKLLFAVVWASFGIMTVQRIDGLSAQAGLLTESVRVERWTGFVIGFVGGTLVASITGVGIDMMIYAVLVLARRADLRVGIPTSVILMASTSLVGIFWQGLILEDTHPELFGNWLAAAPVVALGAPFGALIVNRIGRKPTLLIVAVLCIGQFIWTLSEEFEHLGWLGLVLSAGGLFVVHRMFENLSRWGDKLAEGREDSLRPPVAVPSTEIS